MPRPYARAHRYISPAFPHDASGVIQRLLSAGRTNRPNLDLFALNHQGAGKENPVNEEQLKKLRERLGLATDARAGGFRHVRTTHLLERTQSLAGVAFLVGHKHVTTTNKYVRPNQRAGEAALRDAFRPPSGHRAKKKKRPPKRAL